MTGKSSSAIKPSYSRNILQGRSLNKHGVQNGFGPGSGAKHLRHLKSLNKKRDHEAYRQGRHAVIDAAEQIVVAPPPRKDIKLNRDELRFTLPDTALNAAIRIAQIRRAYATQQLLMRDLNTELRCRSGSTDDRVEVL